MKHETKIIQYLAEGLTAQQIADKLHLTKRTAETYIDEIKKTHEAKNVANLIAKAFRNKIIA
jgi:DNA-binding NarL/FixJ family response regulator